MEPLLFVGVVRILIWLTGTVVAVRNRRPMAAMGFASATIGNVIAVVATLGHPDALAGVTPWVASLASYVATFTGVLVVGGYLRLMTDYRQCRACLKALTDAVQEEGQSAAQ